MAANISKKRKFVADGVFYAEINEVNCVYYCRIINIVNFLCLQFLRTELAEDGYAGVEVRVTPLRTEIIIKATRTQDVLGEKGQRIRELTSVVQKRYVTTTFTTYV